jgi:hypothetical protein
MCKRKYIVLNIEYIAYCIKKYIAYIAYIAFIYNIAHCMTDLIIIIYFRAGEADHSFKRPAFRMPEPHYKKNRLARFKVFSSTFYQSYGYLFSSKNYYC